MGSFEDALERMFLESRWEAPNLAPLGLALGALERALKDLSQVDPDKWSGEAAEGAAQAFDELRGRYGRMKDAVHDVVETVTAANRARDRAYTAFHELPDTTVPGYVHTAVRAAKVAGHANVVIGGFAYVTGHAVSAFERAFERDREEKAREVYVALQHDLEAERDKLANSKEEIKAVAGVITFGDETSSGDSSGGGGPVPPIPDPRGGGGYPRLPDNPDYPDYPDEGRQPGDGRRPGEDDWARVPGDENWGRTPGDDNWGRPPGDDNWGRPPSDDNWGRPPSDDNWTPSPYPNDPWEPTPGRPHEPWQPMPGSGHTGPNVDSGSSGTIGNPGLNGGLMGGAALAGGAALRWNSQGGALGPNAPGTGIPPGGLGGSGGAGGLGGAAGLGGRPGMGGGFGPGGVGGGLAGGRGLAGGLPTGAAGSGGTGAGAGAGSSGAGAGSGAGARGGMMAGGAPMGGRGGAGGGGGNKDKKSGLGGHIAPKLEDDDDFTPQSDSARAGSRDEFQD